MSILAAVTRRGLQTLALGLAGWLLMPTLTRGQGCLCGTLADEFRAAEAGLVREWIVQVPFDSGGWQLERVVVGKGLVLAQCGDGSVHAIRASGTTAARGGTVAWSRTIGAAAGHSWPPTIGTRLVVVSSELSVHALDRDTGVVQWERHIGSLTAAAAEQSGDWVYQPLRTHRILRLPVNPVGRPADERPSASDTPAPGSSPEATASPRAPESLDPVSIDAGGSFECAPIAVEPHVLWITTGGLVSLQRTNLGWIRHELPESNPPSWIRQAKLTLAGPPVVRDGSIFVASRNGVAGVTFKTVQPADAREAAAPESDEDLSMRVAWFTPFSAAIASGPLVAGDVVLVSLGPAGVAALSAVDGRLLWRNALVGTLVATAGGRAWLLDEVGRLTALDLATGSRRQSFCAGCFTLPVVNTASERLILASPGGLLVSLAPPPTPRPPVSDDAPGPEAPAPADPDATPP